MLDQLSNLHAKCFPEKPWTASDFADLKKSGCEVIASQSGFIVWRVVMDEAELISIGVEPHARKTGIATAMLGIMDGELRKNGVKKVFLEVAENNHPARALYEQNGYKQVGIRPKYYDGIDAILMSKDL